jgi:hypothetical protein
MTNSKISFSQIATLFALLEEHLCDNQDAIDKSIETGIEDEEIQDFLEGAAGLAWELTRLSVVKAKAKPVAGD